ncbi:MAG: hypothetical protein JWR22_2729 [Herminiimonas sp.]|nr:hypothetical protein [Herminiimonas sp.]
MPARAGVFISEWRKPPAWLSAGREAIRLQANRRPAACRRVPSPVAKYKTPAHAGVFLWWSGESRLRGFRRGSKRFACRGIGGLRNVGESRPLSPNTKRPRMRAFFFGGWRKPPVLASSSWVYGLVELVSMALLIVILFFHRLSRRHPCAMAVVFITIMAIGITRCAGRGLRIAAGRIG